MQKDPAESIQQELHELGSSLKMQDKQAGFSLPDGYFERLPYQVQARINSGDAETRWAGRFIPARKFVLAFVSVMIVVGISFSVYFFSRNAQQDYLLSADELFQMSFFNTYANLDAHYLYDMVLETNITADEIMYGSYFAETSVDHDLIFDYFDQVLEINDMATELFMSTESLPNEHTF